MASSIVTRVFAAVSNIPEAVYLVFAVKLNATLNGYLGAAKR